jgi:hypothetical protein
MYNFLYFLALTSIDISQLPTAKDNSEALIVNIVFSIAGALALLFVVIGGFRYVLSQGDPNATSQAKNTILFALVGLAVTVLAYVIVRFVVSNI